MPELPEVETTSRGIAPYIKGKTIQSVTVWQPKLRWKIPDNLVFCIVGSSIESITRRGKYLLFNLSNQHSLISHLGMSGSLRILTDEQVKRKHDHWQIQFDNCILRYHDPRRFGALLYTDNPKQHSLLNSLGVEPLTQQFNGDYLYRLSRNKSSNVKAFIMDAKVVVGVGNIYATEALFLAGISPKRRANSINIERYQQLSTHIKQVLSDAIAQGGTTLRNYVNSDGNEGYFQLALNTYGRGNEPCVQCGQPLTAIRQNQRSTVYCTYCQT